MRKRMSSVVSLSAIVLLLSCLPYIAGAADVSGTMVVNNKKFKLSHGYVDMAQPDEPIIVLSDKALPAEQVPFLQADYAVKKKVHAVVFGILKSEKKVSPLRWAYFGGAADIPFTVFHDDSISFELKRLDDTLVEGKIKTSKAVKLTDLTYSFDASFKLSVKAAMAKATAPKKVSFSGDDSAPVKAYKEYYRAIMEGNADNMKKYLVSKNLKEFEAYDDKDRAMVLDLLKMRPEKLKIQKPVVSGDQATFKAEGKEGSDTSTGSIKMTLDDGKWKVLEDKWETISK